MAAANGIVYSLYRSQLKDPMPAAVLHGCGVNMLGKGSCGKGAVVVGALYAGAE